MNNKSNRLTEKVNVTMHTVSLNEKGVSYAKVKRNTAYIGNIIDKILGKNTVLDRETLLYTAGLLRNGIVELLKEGKAVDILELGVLYIKPDGGINAEKPGISDVPDMKPAFTPSELALSAVKGVAVAADVTAVNEPEIHEVYNLKTCSCGTELSAGYSARIKGRRLKVAGSGEESGVFLVPCNEDGTANGESPNRIHIAETDLIDNTSGNLLFNVPPGTASGTYLLSVKTAYGSGSRVNKTVRTGQFSEIVSVS